MNARIRRVGDARLAELLVAAGRDLAARRELGRDVDTTTDVLLIGDGPGGPDRTAAAAHLLAVTRRTVIVPIIGADQHPINVGRAIASLTNLHARRIGIAGGDPSVLALLSRLFESWPADSVVGDADRGVYVDDTRILRIDDPVHPIGGPLTVPVDTADKPVTVLLDAEGKPSPGVDVVLDLSAIAPWDTRESTVSGTTAGARAVFGLPDSTPFATGVPAFAGVGRLDQV